MWQLIVRGVIAGFVVVTASELARRSPRVGAVVLTLPLVSIVAFIATWYRQRDLVTISRLARETLVLVPLGLPFFLPLAFAQRLGLHFWTAFVLGFILATATISLWLWLGPRTT
jgi:hypothetical protein